MTHVARQYGTSSAVHGFGCATGDKVGKVLEVVQGPAVLQVTAIRKNGGSKQEGGDDRFEQHGEREMLSGW